jgi:hypothetical protein
MTASLNKVRTLSILWTVASKWFRRPNTIQRLFEINCRTGIDVQRSGGIEVSYASVQRWQCVNGIGRLKHRRWQFGHDQGNAMRNGEIKHRARPRTQFWVLVIFVPSWSSIISPQAIFHKVIHGWQESEAGHCSLLGAWLGKWWWRMKNFMPANENWSKKIFC